MTESKALKPVEALQQGLEQFSHKLAQSLPQGLSVDKFVRTVMQGVQTHKDQSKILNASRKSLFLAVQKAAGDGLQLDGREAALVVFGDEVTYMPMVQGLIRLARNSGEIASIVAEVVYSNDKFTYRIGTDEMPLHEPDWFGDRGKPVGAWAVVRLKNGEVISTIMSQKDIMSTVSKSKNLYQYDTVKGAHFKEWWKKTVIKNVLKYAPKSTELERVLQQEEKQDFEEVKEAPATEQSMPEPEKKPRQTRAAKTAKAEQILEPEIIEAEYDNVTGEVYPDPSDDSFYDIDEDQVPV
jgi:recombination protein RecT